MPLLRDPVRQQEFESRDYVVLPFLGEADVARLARLYESVALEPLTHRLRSVGGERPDLQRLFRDTFEEIAADALARLFVPCDVLIGNFLIKPPRRDGAVPPHQDWTILERGGSGATIWMPLADLGVDMGALGILPGGHRLFSDRGYAPSAFGYKVLPYADYAMDLVPYMDFVPLAAGEAMIFHGGAVHASMPNVSDRTRVAAIFSVVTKGSPLSLPYLLPNTGLSKFESFELSSGDFPEYHNGRLTALFEQGERPHGLVSRGVFDVERTRFTRDEAIARIESTGSLKRDLPV